LALESPTFLDVRASNDFGAGHPPGSVNIGLGGQFAAWAGCLLDPVRPIVLVTEGSEQASEATMRLSRVGLDLVAGYLTPEVWARAGHPLPTLPQLSVDELREELPGLVVADVRRAGEFAAGHVPGAVNLPLGRLLDDLGRLNPARPTAVICAGGYRSSAAASLLARAGFQDVRNVVGGTTAWLASGAEVEVPPPQSSR
jgi:hydroxyacylglutathione hydrolase